MLASNCRTGRELREAWRKVKTEAEQLSAFLEEEVPSLLKCEAGAIGEGRTDGSPRALMVKAMEKLRVDALHWTRL